MQLFLHGVHTRWSSVVLFYSSCRPSMIFFSPVPWCFWLYVKGSHTGLAHNTAYVVQMLCIFHFSASPWWSCCCVWGSHVGCTFRGGRTSSSARPNVLGCRGLAVGHVGHEGQWHLCGRLCRLQWVCRWRLFPLVGHNSFILNKKRLGPATELCGTPDSTGINVGLALLSTTFKNKKTPNYGDSLWSYSCLDLPYNSTQ